MNINMNFATRAAAALSLGTLLATTACTDYAQEFKDDENNKIYAESDPVISSGDEDYVTNTYDFDIPFYPVDRNVFNMIWYGYDGKKFQTTAGAGIYYGESCNFIVFDGRDSLGNDFSTSSDMFDFEGHAMPDVMSLLRRAGGISGTVHTIGACSATGATTDKAQIVFALDEYTDLSTFDELTFGFQYEGETHITVGLASIKVNEDKSFSLENEHKTYWVMDGEEGEKKFVTAGLPFEDMFRKNMFEEVDLSILKDLNAIVFEFDYATLNMGSSSFFNIVFVGLQQVDQNQASPTVDTQAWSNFEPFPICGSVQECNAAHEITGCECSALNEEDGFPYFKISGCKAYKDNVLYVWEGPVEQSIDPFTGAYRNVDSVHVKGVLGVTDFSALDPISVRVTGIFGDTVNVSCPAPRIVDSSSSNGSFSSATGGFCSSSDLKAGKCFHWSGSEGVYRIDFGETFKDMNDEGGYWFDFTDSQERGASKITWPVPLGNAYDTYAFDPVIDQCGGICGSFELKQESAITDPYVGIGFNISGSDLKKEEDVSAWGGLCVVYSSSTPITLNLMPNEQITTAVSHDVPVATLSPSLTAATVDIPWKAFSQGGWGHQEKISGPEVATKLNRILLDFSGADGTSGKFNIMEIGSLETCSKH